MIKIKFLFIVLLFMRIISLQNYSFLLNCTNFTLFYLKNKKIFHKLFVYLQKKQYLCARFSTIVSGDQRRVRIFVARTVVNTIVI